MRMYKRENVRKEAVPCIRGSERKGMSPIGGAGDLGTEEKGDGGRVRGDLRGDEGKEMRMSKAMEDTEFLLNSREERKPKKGLEERHHMTK